MLPATPELVCRETVVPLRLIGKLAIFVLGDALAVDKIAILAPGRVNRAGFEHIEAFHVLSFLNVRGSFMPAKH